MQNYGIRIKLLTTTKGLAMQLGQIAISDHVHVFQIGTSLEQL